MNVPDDKILNFGITNFPDDNVPIVNSGEVTCPEQLLFGLHSILKLIFIGSNREIILVFKISYTDIIKPTDFALFHTYIKFTVLLLLADTTNWSWDILKSIVPIVILLFKVAVRLTDPIDSEYVEYR